LGKMVMNRVCFKIRWVFHKLLGPAGMPAVIHPRVCEAKNRRRKSPRRAFAGTDAGCDTSLGLRSKPKPKIAMDGNFGQRKGLEGFSHAVGGTGARTRGAPQSPVFCGAKNAPT
jgi:hypothetical protein